MIIPRFNTRVNCILILIALAFLAACGRYPIPTQPAPARVAAASYKIILPVIGCNPCAARPAPTPLPPVRNPNAYGVADLDGDCSTIAKIGARWIYDYSRVPGHCPGAESVPMIQAASSVSLTVGGSSRWILGFNEPDMPGWAHQSPEEAAVNWRILEETHADKLLVAPAPMSGATYDPANWLHLWRAAYIAKYNTDPRINALAVHVYFIEAANAEAPVREAEELASAWGASEVWVTEWGLARGDPGGQEAAFLDWLQARPKVTRYAWFGSRINVQLGISQGWYGTDWADMSLVDWNTRLLTGFGEEYVRYAPQ